jgi:DNA-binding IclR family transcriptional regulator
LSEIQSLARGLKILDILAQADGSVSVTQIAEAFDIDKSSASRLVQTLANYGYAEQDPRSRRYYLGTKVMALSRNWLRRSPLHEYARPFLHDLVEATGECSHVAIYSRGAAFFIADVESHATLRVATGIGRTTPLHCTAVGKVLMTFGGIELPQELRAETPRTIINHNQLRLHLEQVRYQGYAVDDEEFTAGVRCLAVPVFDHTGHGIATMGISGPSVRMTMDLIPEFAEIVMGAAAGLSKRLGFHAVSEESG